MSDDPMWKETSTRLIDSVWILFSNIKALHCEGEQKKKNNSPVKRRYRKKTILRGKAVTQVIADEDWEQPTSALQAAAGRSVQLWGEEVKLAKVMAMMLQGWRLISFIRQPGRRCEAPTVGWYSGTSSKSNVIFYKQPAKGAQEAENSLVAC